MRRDHNPRVGGSSPSPGTRQPSDGRPLSGISIALEVREARRYLKRPAGAARKTRRVERPSHQSSNDCVSPNESARVTKFSF